MKRLIIHIIIVLAAIAFPMVSFAFSSDIQERLNQHTYPRLVNYYLKWGIESDAERKQLAQWDIVIIDAEAALNTRDQLVALKKDNPNLVLLAYVVSNSIRDNAGTYDQSFRQARFNAIPDSWYLKDAHGNRTSNWPGMSLLNVSDKAPLFNGIRFNDFLIRETSVVLSDPVWDGVFFDNIFDSISWMHKSFDLNNDGFEDSSYVQDYEWSLGVRKILEGVKASHPNKLILGNGGMSYIESHDGLMYENFDNTPYGDWEQTMRQYFKATAHPEDKLTFINTNTGGTPLPKEYRLFRYGLASTLLGNGYYSFDTGWVDHSQLWWYDEYNYELGGPVDDARNLTGSTTSGSEGVWRRDYADGVVLVNATDSSQFVALGSEYEKLHGDQDARVNNGRIVESLTLGARDGVLLLKPLERVAGDAIVNGSFARFFDGSGRNIRTGLFTAEDQFPDADVVVRIDYDEDGSDEFVVSQDEYIILYENNGNEVKRFLPYDNTYRGELNIQVSDLESDGSFEIITAPTAGGPYIRIFNMDGRLLTPGFFAYHPSFRGGVNISVGDLDGDGNKEIVAGSGYTGGPHVRIFNKDGRLLSPGFFAYDTRFRGGVNVAVGDVTGDGVAEIVTGPGRGGSPHVRIFDKEGNAINGGFYGLSKSNRSGIRVIVNNIDGQGAEEILVISDDIFSLFSF